MSKFIQIVTMLLVLASIFLCLPTAEIADNTIDGWKLLSYPLIVWICAVIFLFVSWDGLIRLAPERKAAIILVSFAMLAILCATTVWLNYRFSENTEPQYIPATVLNTYISKGKYRRNIAIFDTTDATRKFTIWAGFDSMAAGQRVTLLKCEGFFGFSYFINPSFYRFKVNPKNRNCRHFL